MLKCNSSYFWSILGEYKYAVIYVKKCLHYLLSNLTEAKITIILPSVLACSSVSSRQLITWLKCDVLIGLYVRAQSENMSLCICGQWELRSVCESAQSDQGFLCPLTELFNTIEWSMESKCPDETLRKRGMNMNLCILRMLEDTFSLGAARIIR